MPEEWKVLVNLADGLTVVAVLLIDLYVIIFSGKLVTRDHMEDVGKELGQRVADLQGERDRAVGREEEARRELAENNEVLGRLESTVREALQSLGRRR
jgi:hypothetical protein